MACRRPQTYVDPVVWSLIGHEMWTAGTQRNSHHEDCCLTDSHEVNCRHQLRRDAISDQAGDAFLLSQGIRHADNDAVVVHADDQTATGGVGERDNCAQRLRG